MPFVKAFKTSELAPNQGRCVELDGKRIAVFRCNDAFYAIDDACTHAEASLSEGGALAEDGQCIVECPWHGARFDLKTGKALRFPAVEPVKTYPVRVQDDTIEVEV